MTSRTRSLIGVAIMSALLVLYFAYAGVRAIALVQTGSALSISMGIALLVLPLIGVWALARELLFGRQSTRLVDLLDQQGRVPEEELELLPSGKPARADADQVFPKYRAEVEADTSSWQAWMRLGIMYDACGDRPRARAAIRRAIALERDSRRAQD